MAVETAVAPQAQEPLPGNHAEREEGGVEPGRVVALRREVDVPVRVLPAERGRVQLLEEEEGDDVHRAEARAEVPRHRALDGEKRVQPAYVREQRDPLVGRSVRRSDAVEGALRDQLQLAAVRRETLDGRDTGGG